MDNNITKIAQIINNGLSLLGRKLDTLTNEVIRSNKAPIVNVKTPDVNVDMKDFIVPKIKVSEVVMPDMPEIVMPEFPPFPKYPDFPEIKIPKIEVPPAKVTVNFPEIPTPIVNVPPANITVTPTPVEFPKEMKVEGMDKLIESMTQKEEIEKQNIFEEVNSKSPLAVMIVDKKGKQISEFGGEFSAPSMVSLRVGTTAVGQDNPMPVTVDGFAIPMFDQEVIDETLAPTTTVITYKRSGVTVATKTITVAGAITTITVT